MNASLAELDAIAAINDNLLKLAARVISAINGNRMPEPEDLNELRRLAPLLAHLPPDDLAINVIERAIRRRHLLRKMASDR